MANTRTIVGAVLQSGIEAAGNSVSRSARHLIRSMALATLAAAGFTSLIGCGNTYRPVVAAINPVGPSSQPSKYAIAMSNPGTGNPGLITIVDFSGDTVLITANIGVDPKYLVLNATGTTGYTINGDGTLNVFGISTSLLTSQILETTLLSDANPVSIFPQGTNTYVSETGRNAIGEFQGSPLALKQELTVTDPVYVVGLSAAPRVYALSGSGGSVSSIETGTNTISSTFNVGTNPVYGIMSADGKRAYIMNKGSGTVSVINVQTNTLDSSTALPTGTIQVGTSPLWADFAPTLSEMAVANAGNGTTNGTLSLISIPLCSALASTTNPNCDTTNPVDATGFGTVLATVPVGVSPVMVSVLQDGTRAYVANSGDTSLPCVSTSTSTATGNCSVSVVNLTSNSVTKTIPLSCRPSYIAATTGTPTGKVYVVCNDSGNLAASQNMTVIETDTDTIDTTIPLQGTGVSVRVTAQ
ncbi:YncE family protein [Granulicella arctica]|uniref:YVTN family beta-propeller protein n=1 Tax=Granulicella arctica TaxID=940613 RepID=A0A7Y9PJE6_9BACT|nr:YncE family protein [Granulicella arctica]NYF81008.1 YVTN family beta-propeller protein [Granulicella arctica]